MIPRVETKAQVERIVECTMFPPIGERGCSVEKGQNDLRKQNLWEFTTEANRENMIILQIERAKAVENIDELLSVPGVAGAVMGPNDLALSMGVRDSDMLGALEQPIQHVLGHSAGRGYPLRHSHSEPGMAGRMAAARDAHAVLRDRRWLSEKRRSQWHRQAKSKQLREEGEP